MTQASLSTLTITQPMIPQVNMQDEVVVRGVAVVEAVMDVAGDKDVEDP